MSIVALAFDFPSSSTLSWSISLRLYADLKLNLHSTVLQQKAVLALAQEQMQVIELERRLVQAETEKGTYTSQFRV